MKRVFFSSAAMCMIANFAIADEMVIRMGTEGAYPPYNFINDNGEIDGFEKELGDELCARAELTCEWVKNDWDNMIPNLVSSNYDTIMAGMSITDERKEQIDFTQNYVPPVPSSFVAMSENVDLESGIIAAQAATTQAGYIAQTSAILVEYATPDETIAALRSGEADAVLADSDFLLPFVEDSAGELIFVGERVPLGSGIGMGLRQSDADLRNKFDTVISNMKEDGSLNALLIKWFGQDTALFE